MARVHQELMNMRGVSIQMNFLQSLCLEIPPPFNFEKFGRFTLAWFRIKLKHKQNKSIQPMHWIRLTQMLNLFNCLYPNSRIRPFFFSFSSVTVRQPRLFDLAKDNGTFLREYSQPAGHQILSTLLLANRIPKWPFLGPTPGAYTWDTGNMNLFFIRFCVAQLT